MNRIFGGTNTAPKPTLTSVISSNETRIESVNVKVAKLDAQISYYKATMAKMSEGSRKLRTHDKMVAAIIQRNRLDSRIDGIEQINRNLEQLDDLQHDSQNLETTMEAMKTTGKKLQKQYRKFDIDKIESLQDEMAELMEVANDIEASLNRSYDLPEEIDEAELEAELEALGDGIGFGVDPIEEHEMSRFLTESGPPEFIDEAPQAAAKQTAT